MSRTMSTAVRDILLKDYDSVDEPSLAAFIETASSLTDDVETCALAKGITYSLSKLELIERWLSAHAYAMSDQPYTQRSTLRASGMFQGLTKMYFEATKYGQMAVNLDSAGCLRNAGQKKTVRADWLGKRPSNQTDYVDRD